MHDRDLQSLGLGSHEAKVYGVLLEHSPAGASLIAKRAGISRSSVYTTLGILASKGLVATTYKNEVKQFTATGADAFERLLARERDGAAARLQSFAKLRQHLDLTTRGDHHIPKVMLFEGVEGLQRIYLAMLREAHPKAELLVLRSEFLWEPVWAFSWTDDWRSRIRRWKREKDIRTRLLVNPSPLEQSKADFYRTRYQFAFRYLPESHAVDRFALYVIGDTVAIMSFETGSIIGIQIVNAHIAANVTKLFDGLWNISAPQRKNGES
ncbi:helix-turn-helix domain-containing protein [Candidatus Uhrbacteria bacterium]|nr:helix-turn-helix domain-containing protein [Candidatus Uhrbacteria bacterium]